MSGLVCCARRTRRFRLSMVPLAIVCCVAVPARAQTPTSREEENARKQAEKAKVVHPYRQNRFERRLLELEERGGLTIQRGLFVAFGDIKSGSGIALGPAYGKILDNGTTVIGKGVYSVRNFKLLQISALSAPLAGGRVTLSGRGRWQDAPKVALYALGPESPNTHTDYAESMTEVSGQMSLQPLPFVRVGGGTGVEIYNTQEADESLVGEVAFTPQTLPGLGADPTYLHSFATAAIDSRDGLTYSRSGSLLQATLHDYRQQNNGPYSFRRIDGIAQQFIPILHGNTVIDLALRASTTSADDGETVPFFLTPRLGGGRGLRGFPSYRFRDRHSILFTAEYRWYVQEYVDMGVYYEAGKVTSRRSELDFDDLESDVGIGIRFHTPRAMVLRLEVARSNENVRFIFGFGIPTF